jgi:SanA protein
MKYFWILFISLIILGLIGVLCAYLINWQVKSYSIDKISLTIGDVPIEEPNRVAIVYGAAVYKNGKLSDALYDRVFTAVELYKAKKVKKLLMSGDNSRKGYDEPTAMKNEAVNLGVPENDIVMDFAGRRTYDTCHRAKEIFEVKKAIHVTQEFHLPRAIYLCENMGVESIGIKANRRKYLDENAWAKREFLAVLSAWFDINIISPTPISGEKEPIEQ